MNLGYRLNWNVTVPELLWICVPELFWKQILSLGFRAKKFQNETKVDPIWGFSSFDIQNFSDFSDEVTVVTRASLEVVLK